MTLTELLLMIFTAPVAGIVIITVQYRQEIHARRQKGRRHDQ